MPRTRTPKRTPASFRNADFTDRELLANISEAADAEGWATTTEIAIACGYTGNGAKGRTPANRIGSRLSWMRAGSLLESTGPDYTVLASVPGGRDTRWRLTDLGEDLLRGSLSRAVANAVERMDPGAMVLLMQELTRRGYIEGEYGLAFAMRRMYQHQVAQRRLVFRIGGNGG